MAAVGLAGLPEELAATAVGDLPFAWASPGLPLYGGRSRLDRRRNCAYWDWPLLPASVGLPSKSTCKR